MNRLIKLLLVFALTTISYGAFSQQQNVAKNSIHIYKMNNDVGTNKYLWRVIKSDGTDAQLGVDYEFVTSYTNFTIPADANEVALATTDLEMNDHQNAKTGQHVVYIRWKVEGTYNVHARVFDNTTGCSDESYNHYTTPDVVVGTNDFVANITSDVRRDVDTNKDGEINDSDTPVSCALRDVSGKTQVSFTIKLTGNRQTDDPAKEAETRWRYKFKYFFGDAEPADWSTVDNESDFVDRADNEDGPITVEGIVPTGDGQYHVWVLITEIYDGYGLAPNATSTLKAEAILNKIPTKQTITSD